MGEQEREREGHDETRRARGLVLRLELLVLLLDNRQLSSGQTSHIDHHLKLSVGLSRSDAEAVVQTGRERVTALILDVSDVEASRVLLFVHEGTDTSAIASLGNHDGASNIHGGEAYDLLRDEVELDRVGRLDQRIRVSAGARTREGESAACVEEDDEADRTRWATRPSASRVSFTNDQLVQAM